MSKSLPLEAVKTMLKPVMHLIGKKADREDVATVATAKAGQYMRVKTVDDADKPTEWEANELPKLTMSTLDGDVVYNGMDDKNIVVPTKLDGIGNRVPWAFVSDRPAFMYDTDYVEIMKLTNVTFTDGVWPIDRQIEIGEFGTYEVTYNGTVYSGEIVYDEDKDKTSLMCYMGNPAYIGIGDDNGMPFAVGLPLYPPDSDIGYGAIASMDASASIKIRCSGLRKTIDRRLLRSFPWQEDQTYNLTGTENKVIVTSTKHFVFGKYDGVRINIEAPAATAVNGISVEFYNETKLLCYMWLPAGLDTTTKYAMCEAVRKHGEWEFYATNPVATQNQVSQMLRSLHYVSGDEEITKVVLYPGGGASFPAGTTIKTKGYNGAI